MDKAERHRRKMVRYRRRLRVLGLSEQDGHHAYRTSGKPCSCGVCSPYRLAGPAVRDLRRL